MIRGGFLSEEDRNKLIALVRDGSAASRVTRRANTLVLLDDGWRCQEVADAFLLNDDTIRGWFKLFEQHGIEGLTSFDMGGSASFLSVAQEEALKVFVSATLPPSTRHVGAWIEQEFGLVYQSRSGLIALLHRLGLEYHKPNVIARKLDEDKQRDFIESYEKLLNSLSEDEAVLFADAVHPTHAARPAGCWAPKQETLAIEQTSGRETPQRPFPFHPDPVVVAQSGRNLVFDPAGPVTERRLLRRGRAIAGAHRCFHRSIQRDSRAIRLDQEKGLSAAIQKSPYHSTLIPGTSHWRRLHYLLPGKARTADARYALSVC